jgi:hypothetical protein
MLLAVAARQTDNSERKKNEKNQWKYIYIFIFIYIYFYHLGDALNFWKTKTSPKTWPSHSHRRAWDVVVVPGQED